MTFLHEEEGEETCHVSFKPCKTFSGENTVGSVEEKQGTKCVQGFHRQLVSRPHSHHPGPYVELR